MRLIIKDNNSSIHLTFDSSDWVLVTSFFKGNGHDVSTNYRDQVVTVQLAKSCSCPPKKERKMCTCKLTKDENGYCDGSHIQLNKK